MANILSFLAWFALCGFWTFCSATTIYVSQDGIDSALCGDEAAPCGTLWQASVLVNALNASAVPVAGVVVIDGQNEIEIARHLLAQDTNGFDPCLPVPFSALIEVEIDFDNITSMEDWYPMALCPEDSTAYANEYLFDWGKMLSLTNLRVNDYTVTDETRYPLIRGSWEFNDATVTCTDCVLRNIASSLSNPTDVLIHSRVSLLLYNMQMSDIVCSTNVMSVDVALTGGSTQNIAPLYSRAHRKLWIFDSEFSNIETADNMLFISVCDAASNVTIRDSTFTGIRTGESLLTTTNWYDDVEISRCTFDIDLGSVFSPFHIRPSNIAFNDVTFMTAQPELSDGALVRSGSGDTVTMTNTDIVYTYNVTEGCLGFSSPRNQSNTVPSQDSWLEWSCKNPYLFLFSEGPVTMRDTHLDAVLTGLPPVDPTTVNYEFTSNWGQVGSACMFLTYGEFNLENFQLRNGLARYVFRNYDVMNVVNFTTFYDEATYNPQIAMPSSVFTSWGADAVLSIDASHVKGFKRWGTLAYTSSLHITNSIFELGPIAIPALYNVEVTVTNSTFLRVGGQYNTLLLDNAEAAGIYLVRSSKVVFTNNRVSGYDPYGLMYLYGVVDALLIGNTFTVDTGGLVFEVPDEEAFMFPGYSPVNFYQVGTSELIDNVFDSSPLDPSMHWVLYRESGAGYHGVCGNTFTNAAINVSDTNVTSCFRPSLIDCRDVTVGQCEYGIYGNMTVEFKDLVQLIEVTEAVDSILHVQNGNLALDHVRVQTDGDNLAVVSAVNSTVLIVDSTLSEGLDLSYYPSECDIAYHNRLSADTSVIAKLQFECADASADRALETTMEESDALQLVESLGPVSIAVHSVGSTYYPGQLLQFTYTVSDELGNAIDYEASEKLEILLENDKFRAALDVEPTGECPQCSHGVLINLLQINKHIGLREVLYVTIQNNVLLSENSEIWLNITGCPAGYGPDENNATCVVCNNGYFNMWSVSVDSCRSCDADSNTGVDCADGDIVVESEHWMGFHRDDDQTIISALCPSRFCCQHGDGCKFNDADNHAMGGVLCAKNRDPSTQLCGSCVEGFSESMNSAKCTLCDGHHLEFLLFPVSACVLLTLLVFFCSTEPLTKKTTDPKKEVVAPKSIWQAMVKVGYFQFMIRTMVLKNIFYYQQAVAQMLTTSTYQVLFRDVSAQFELSVTSAVFDAEDSSLWCFIDGLSAKGKILVDLLTPALVFTMVTVVFVVSRYILKRPLGCCSKNKRINFSKAYITTFLILIGKVLDVLFKLMSCQQVGSEYAHYYFGYETCYETSWWLAFIFMIIIVAVFTMVFVHLKRMDEVQRQSRSNALNRFVSRYKPQYWYWEYALFVRRILIAVFAVSVQDITAKFFFAGILIMFVFVQHKVQPFKVQESNELETLLLCFLVFIQVTTISPSFNPVSVNVVVSLLIIAPFLLLVYYVRHIYVTKVVGGANAHAADGSVPAALTSMQSGLSDGFSDGGSDDPQPLGRVTSDSGLGRTGDVEMQAGTNNETDGRATTTTTAEDEQP